MDCIEIDGGRPLEGSVRISGAKNAALPLLCSALLADGKHIFNNVPDLRDVHTTVELLGTMGQHAVYRDGTMVIDASPVEEPEAPYEVVKKMRASVLVLGPLVARYGRARVSLPGGCAIGARPIDQHLRGLEKMGAQVELTGGYVEVTVPKGRLDGAEIALDCPTVTGTENLMCAAVLARGRTRLLNAAREPEVEELARLLNKMGAEVQGAGTNTVLIEGKEALSPVEHSIISDRIEAGTYMCAIAATGGNARVDRMSAEPLSALIAKMREAGVIVEMDGQGIRVVGQERYKPVDVKTAPHPGFPTDMQAQFMALMCLANGRSMLTETVFENRFMHVPELNRMGARINTNGRVAVIDGRAELTGAEVMATDLRASASLVVAGLVASGTTRVRRVYHLDRGYEHLETKLGGLGAQVRRVPGPG